MKAYFKDLKKVFKFYYSYTKYRIFILMLLSGFSGVLEGLGISMLFPLLESLITSENGESSGNTVFFDAVLEWFGLEQTTVVLLLFFILLFLLKSLFKYSVGVYKTNLSTQMLKKIRVDFLQSFLGIDYQSYMGMDSGKLANTFTLELEKTISGFIYFCNYFVSIFSGLAFLLIVFSISVPFTILIVLVGFFYFLVFSRINRKIQTFSKGISKNNSDFNSLIIQLVQSFKYIQSTNSKNGITKKLENNIEEIRNLKLKMDLRQSFVSAAQEPVVIILLIGVVYLNVILFKTSITSIITILLLFYRSLNYFLTSQITWNNFVSQIGSTESVISLKSHLVESSEASSGQLKAKFEYSINLENVSFGYSDERLILKNIQIAIPKNKTIAFVGKSGSGKTTLVNLITGLLRPTQGKLFIDGVEIESLQLNEWRRKIGYITQESVLFNDNLVNNVTMWDTHKPFDRAAFERAIELGKVRDFYDDSVDREKIIGDKGVVLSGGQRQRLSIARELYKAPSLLILDEATSALDSETENFISQSISKLQGSITILIIAHRLSTIKNADLVYVLDEGLVSESGSYEELSKNAQSRLSQLIKIQELR